MQVSTDVPSFFTHLELAQFWPPMSNNPASMKDCMYSNDLVRPLSTPSLREGCLLMI